MKVQSRCFLHLACAMGLLLLLVSALAAQTIEPSGPFGFLLNASYTDPTNEAGVAILGLMNFDGAGHVHGPYTLEFGSSPSNIQTVTGNFTGTYTSHANGTGGVKLNLDNGTSLTLSMVISDGNQHLDLIATAATGGSFDLSTSVVSGFGVVAKAKSLAALKGNYGGQFIYSPQPSRFNSVAAFDGAGNVTMTGTFVNAGPGVSSLDYPGTYAVNSNATGTIVLAATPTQGAQTFVFVMTGEGDPGMLLLQLNRLGDGVAFGTAHLE